MEKKMKRRWRWLAILMLILSLPVMLGAADMSDLGEPRDGEGLHSSETSMLSFFFGPNAYEGKIVVFTAYLDIEGEIPAFYMTQEDYLYENLENAIAIEKYQIEEVRQKAPQGQGQGQGQGQTVEVMGVISFKDKGAFMARVVELKGLIEQIYPVDVQPRENETFPSKEIPMAQENRTYGDGSSREKAIPISLYRYLYNPYPYQCKYIEVQCVAKVAHRAGRIQFVWLPDKYYMDESVSGGGDSSVLGKDKINNPVFNPEYYNRPINIRTYIEGLGRRSEPYDGLIFGLPAFLRVTAEKLAVRQGYGE